jgi:uncharacterized protein YbcI
MEAGSTAPPGRTQGEVAAHISREMVQLMRKTAGRGPTRARTTIGRDHVLVLFRETLTHGEQVLVDHGLENRVLGVRDGYQAVFQEEARAMIERVLGRRVVGFMSSNHFDPDLAAEVFVLEDTPDESRASPPEEAEHHEPG